MTEIAVVDSGVANLASVMAALRRLGAKAEVTADAGKIRTSARVILPGVGAAAPAMAQLKAKGLIDVLRGLTQPVLGICLGMQLLFARSLEGKEPVDCLGILPGEIAPLEPGPGLPVPHMGWNQIMPAKPGHPLLQDLAPGSYVYFVHSYAAPVAETTIAASEYGKPFTAIAGLRNFHGCQFHPERSGAAGARILQNFLRM